MSNEMTQEQIIAKAVGSAMDGFFANEKKQKVERYRRLNKMVKKGQIVFAGSSLMEQFPINEMMQNLDVKLPYAIYNRGIGGYVTTEMMEVLDVVVTDLEPKFVFINIGTNDLSAVDYEESVLIERYRKILNTIKEKLPETQIFMLAYYPMCPEVGKNIPWMADVLTRRDNARVEAANRAVEALAKELGHTFINCNAGIVDENGDMKAEYTIEGMHMYADGYEKVLDELLLILKNL